jgi:hypothetical protein
MKPEQWIIEGDVGTSSRTIWAVMTGIVKGKSRCGIHYDTPKDPDDFSRCYKLITLFPQWRGRLEEVSDIFPKWIPFIREWDKLENLYALWVINVDKYYKLTSKQRKMFKFTDGMYEFMQLLDEEAMLLDGWKKTGKGSYNRPNHNIF